MIPSWTTLRDIEPVDVVLRTGEIIAMPAHVAKFREQVLEERQRDRLAYCDIHDIDPESWAGCHGCEGTGFHRENHLTCWCGYGTAQQAKLDRQDEERTEWLRRNWDRIVKESNTHV